MLARTSPYTAFCIVIVATLFFLPPAAMAATYSVPGNFATISQAIANASGGDTITVDSGTYGEHLVIDKRLTLLGRDTGAGRPTIDALGIEVADDGRDIRLQKARAQDDEDQPEKEHHLPAEKSRKADREVPAGDEYRPIKDRPPQAEKPVGDPAARQ
jgi:hypothetical protein